MTKNRLGALLVDETQMEVGRFAVVNQIVAIKEGRISGSPDHTVMPSVTYLKREQSSRLIGYTSLDRAVKSGRIALPELASAVASQRSLQYSRDGALSLPLVSTHPT